MTALIGRDSEIATLKQHLADAISGKGSTILISGEPGIGKTRLVEEFRNHAEAEGVKILSGAAMSGSAQPFQIFSKAFEGVTDKPLFEESEYSSFTEIFAVNSAGLLLGKASSEEGGLDADIFAGMLSAVQDFVRDSFGGGGNAGLGRLEYGDMKILIEHGQHLFLTAVFTGNEHPDMKNTVKQVLKSIEESHGQLIEKWSGKMSEIEPVQEDISRLAEAKFLVRKDLEGVKLENERMRIADRVLETLAHLSNEKPLAMFLEDLHWADESSLFVLNYLARNIRKHPVLLLGTSRPRESDALQKDIENMKNEEIVDEMALVKLDVNYTKSLINVTFSPNDFPDTLAERLYEQSKGNPLFVTEMLKGMLQDRSIASQDGKYTLVSDTYHVPATVEEVVNHRLEALDPDSMAMVEYASCIGQKFDVSLAASNRLIRNPGASLEKLLGSDILLRKNGSLEFSHAIFQSVIYNGIGDRWKAGHHKSIGEHLESAHADSLDEVMYDLARHYSKTKEYKKSSVYCVRAGEKAESTFAVEQALGFYDDALDALSKLDMTQAHERALDILERAGDILFLMGEYDLAIQRLEKAGNSTDDGVTKARMLRKNADVHTKKGEYDIALEIVVTAKNFITDKNTAEFARLLLSEGYPLHRKGDYDKAMSLFGEAITILGEVGAGLSDVGNALRAIGNIHWYKGDYAAALEYYQKSLAAMEEIGDQYGVSAALANIGLVHSARGELEKALEFHGRSLKIKEKIGDKQGIASSLNNIGNEYHNNGELDRALEFHGRSLEIEEKIGDKWGVAASLNNIGNVHHMRGELDRALEFYGRSLAIRERMVDRRGIAMSLNNIGIVHFARGEMDTALEFYTRSLEIRENMGDRKGIISALGNIGEAYLYKGELDRALVFYRRGLIIEEEIGNKQGIALLLNHIGNVHVARKDMETALKNFKRGLDICIEIGDKRMQIQLLCGMAEGNLGLGNLLEALEIAENAAATATGLGLKPRQGMSYRVLGTLQREMKEWDRALEEFSKAQEILEEIGDNRELARLHYEYALLWKARGDSTKAVEQLEIALSEFDRMGMKLWAEKCRKALQELDP